MGGMRMGDDPRTSVTDGEGIVRGTDNVLVADGSVFPTSGGHNPTLTIMATALRNVRRVVGKPYAPVIAPLGPDLGRATPQDDQPLADTGAARATAFIGAATVAAGLALRRAVGSVSSE